MSDRCEIKLGDGTVVTVDAVDVSLLRAKPWRSNADGYIVYNKAVSGKSTSFLLHRVIVKAQTGTSVDHCDRDPRHNWRDNLRVCTQSQNLANRPGWLKPKSSRFKGVSWRKDKSKWEAHIKVHRRKMRLGYFKAEAEAARAYDQAATTHFGNFALINHA